MKLRKYLIGFVSLILTVTVAGCGSAPTTQATTSQPATQNTVAAYTNADLLVDSAWLNSSLDDTSLVIIDTRKDSDYNGGHIRNAINLPPALFDEATTGLPDDKTSLVDAAQLAGLMGQYGISEKNKVVVYGGSVDPQAGRIFWALEYLGHSDVHILDGGYGKWTGDNYPTVTDATVKSQTSFTTKVNSSVLASKDYVLQSLDNGNVKIVDSRNGADWVVKRIPGSVNILFGDYLNSEGTVKSPSDLKTLLGSNGITEGNTIITHCYVGYRSSQAYFIFRLLGYQVSNYDGSTTEWFADSSLPTEP